MSLAWHSAVLARTQPKRFPKLDALIIKPRGYRQPWQQQLAIAQMWAARGMGKIKSKAN